MKPVGIFGGAFAPFHNGHLRLAIEARDQLGLERVHLVPTARSLHRSESRISPARRLEWLKLALRKEKNLIADDREVLRSGPSFTVETLIELRQQYPQAPLVLLMGADAFAHLHSWHRWQEIFDLAHLAVVARHGAKLAASPDCARFLQDRRVSNAQGIQEKIGGHWLQLDLPLLDISSTRIRRLLKTGRSVRGLVPDAILNHMTAADRAALTQDEDATTH
jgi:nicotinate-nucleotide adenylyltransferase